ncbi:extracellular solute-binding protein [Kineosporia sp. A_224]|uniref:extracellular solute-binding protein n=1 Tax=Kineosporia sp. A_224 TaxID=1962180 RepID=UPI000B4C039A|nr:extracellular solute-binding protein [Kineosporia sp. A_224]
MSTTRPRRRVLRAVLGAAVAAGALTACSSGSAGPPSLTWYINPDSGGQAEIAKRCTDAAQGRYTIRTALLPRESSEQRQQLVRRLAANDSSIDIMSLDPPYIPEFAEAGFLAPIPQDMAGRVSDGVVDSALKGATWRDELVTVPFWANTQLLWYRKSVAEAAGLDMTKPVTWDQIIQAAKSQNKQLGVQGIRAEALTVWVNALVASAGGSIIENSDATRPQDVRLGLETPAGAEAAKVIREVADAGVGGPALSTAGEDANVNAFEGPDAGFMVNWPFVWPRAQSGVEGGTLDAAVPQDYGWAPYPRVTADQESHPPYGGINLGVGAFSAHKDLALAATECIVSPENQAYYFVSNGNPAAKESVYTDPEVVKEFPMAPVILESLRLAVPRPQTPYYSEVSEGLQREYHPPSSVDPQRTGREATDLITAVLQKKELL